MNVAWADNSLTENGFTITVASNPGFTQIVQTLAAAADATSLPVYDLNGGTTYYISVAAFNTAGTSAAATARPATTSYPVPLRSTTSTNPAEAPCSTPARALRQTARSSAASRASPGRTMERIGLRRFHRLCEYRQPREAEPARANHHRRMDQAHCGQFAGRHRQPGLDGLDIPFFLDLSNASTVNFGTYRYTGGGNPSVQATGTSSAP